MVVVVVVMVVVIVVEMVVVVVVISGLEGESWRREGGGGVWCSKSRSEEGKGGRYLF